MPPWKVKAALQRAFSTLPGGHRVNYAFQRHVTRGVPVPDADLARAVDLVRDHLRRLGAHTAAPATGAFFEFGAGWDLRIPQLLWCFGVEDQIVVDIRPLARPSLVQDIARRLAAGQERFGLPRVPRTDHPDVGGLLSSLGIDYRAPCDARATDLPSGSIARITSTDTLEHVPPDDIAAILRECHRILADDGLMSFQIDYRDHYAYFDPSLSIYSFLRFEDAVWRRWNPDLHFQNRLRHADHVRLVEDAGFEVVQADTTTGDPAALLALEGLDLASPFRGRTLEENAVCEGRLVLRKAEPQRTRTSGARRVH